MSKYFHGDGGDFVFLVWLRNTLGVIFLISLVVFFLSIRCFFSPPFVFKVSCFYPLAPSELLVLEVLPYYSFTPFLLGELWVLVRCYSIITLLQGFMVCIICREEMNVWHFVISSVVLSPYGGWILRACTRLCRLGLFFSFLALHCDYLFGNLYVPV